MDTVLAAAQRILQHHPAPALRLAELARRLRSEGPDRWIEAVELRRRLEADPRHFRILDVWTGSWRALGSARSPDPNDSEPWVALVTDPEADRVADPVRGRMRECVRWLARRVDGRSFSQVARWHALAVADEAARDAFPQAG